MNVALYGVGGHRWAMTERGRVALRRDRATLSIGPSALRWDGHELTVRVDEVTVPIPSRVCGEIRLRAPRVFGDSFALDREGRHRWRPLAPCARVEVDLERPSLRWSGHGYLDSNRGEEPLEAAFDGWHWSRCAMPDGGTVVLYDVRRRTDDELGLALRLAPSGVVEPLEPPPLAALPSTRWRIARTTRSDDGRGAGVVQTFEDTPFYARSLVASSLHGERVTAVHESLSLERFRRAWVQGLLPFRMPRRRR